MLILAVPDAKITSVSAKLARIFPEGVPLLHTSGATSLKKIDDRFKHRGVLWPIRSLIKGTPTSSWEDLPLVYQANTPIMIELVRNLAEALSWKTYEMNSQDRAQLHLAAVYSNNFVSWLYQISYELCEEKGIPFSVLLPIIRDTAERQTGLEPRWSQTGAAARHDKPTMGEAPEASARPPGVRKALSVGESSDSGGGGWLRGANKLACGGD